MLNQPTCLCCLSVEGRLFSIYEVENYKLYLDAVGLSVVLGDRLPQHVCLSCLTTLRKFSQFRMQCRNVLNMLCRLLEGNKQVVEINQSIASIHRQLKPGYMISKTLTLEISGSDDEDEEDDDVIPSQEASLEKELISKNIPPVGQQNNDVKAELDGPEDYLNNSVPLDATDCQYLEEEYLELDDFDINEHLAKGETKKYQIEVGNKSLNEVAIQAHHDRVPKYVYLSDKRLMTEYAEGLGFDVTELSLEEQVNEIEEKKKRTGFVCELCGKRLINSYCMNRHKIYHVPKPKSFVCDLCSWVFRKKTRFMEHLLSHKFTFSCKHCNFKTKHRGSLEGHCRFHKGETYTCKYCGKVFGKVTSHLSHVRYIHHAELPWCELCGEAFIGEKGVLNHKRLSHHKFDEYPFKCECDKSFRTEDALDRHSVVKGCGLPSCVHCGEALPSPALLKHHLLQRHVGGALPAACQCTGCGARFYEREALQRHECGARAHCPVCGDAFHDTNALEEHVLRKHNTFPCLKCGRRFDAKRYREHYLEDLCTKTRAKRTKNEYSRLVERKNVIHKWRIVGATVCKEERPRPPRPAPRSVCEKCGKGYKSEGHLNMHACPFAERTHACHICGKMFKTELLLKSHETLTHSDERSFLCSRCPKAFKTACALERHYLIHTGERNHLCTVCGKRFMTSTCVKLHIKTVHMKIPVQRKIRQRRKKEKIHDDIE